MKVYVQDADGNERELKVTRPDPEDGTYCAHLNDEEWVRIVPERHEEDRLGGVVEAAIDLAMNTESWLEAMASDPEIEQNTATDVYQALESYICDHLARL